MRWVPRRGRLALCCERRTEPAGERGRAAVSGSLCWQSQTVPGWSGGGGLQGTCPPLTYVCLDPI